VSALEFLSSARCAPETLASPLARALAGAPDTLRDLSLDGKVEIRGDLALVQERPDEELVRLSPRRGLLVGVGDPIDVVERLRETGVRAYDMTCSLAGLGLEGERLLRRLTDLDLDTLPTAGGFARVSAIVIRDDGERFRAYFPQELGYYVAEVVLDAIAGLANEGSRGA